MDAGAVLVCAVEGSSLTKEEVDFFARVAPAGVTLFTRNLAVEPGPILALVRSLVSLQPAGSPPPVIAIDQEGGRVARLKPPLFPNAGPAMALAAGSTDAAALRSIELLAGDVGRRLLALGVNVDFAPVLDVLSEPTNNAIGDRAFATVPGAVTLRAGAFLKGLEASGVAGCLKHFPGQGAATVDTHAGAAVVPGDGALLRERDIAPFRTLLPLARMCMISHCIYPAFSPLEAGRSPEIIQGLLRQELNFQGVVVSDDLNMGALPQERQAWQEALIDAVAAGVDMLLVCRHLDRCWQAYDALTAAAKRSPAFATRLADASSRMRRFRQGLRPVG